MATNDGQSKSTTTEGEGGESKPLISGIRKPPKPTGDTEHDALQAFLFYMGVLSAEERTRVLGYVADKYGHTLNAKPTGTPPQPLGANSIPDRLGTSKA